MTQREIIKALLSRQIPERVGLNEHFWPFINENGWVHKEWRNASWEPAGHSVPLDLTAEGAMITFGFASGASHTTGLDEVTRDTGVNNWHVVICTEP